MAIIWGFDLSQMSWSAFGHKNMFDRRWHLRRERFILYQLAMMTGLAAECTATYSLSKYKSLKNNVQYQSSLISPTRAVLNQSNIINAAVSTIVFCVFVATIFGADFFFLLFWPKRRYPAWFMTTKKVLAVAITAGVGASAIVSTWVVASQQAVLSGVDEATGRQLLDLYYRPPVVYRHWARNIAWVVLLWIAFVSTIASTIIMFVSATHDDRFGTLPKGSLNEKDEATLGQNSQTDTEENVIIPNDINDPGKPRSPLVENRRDTTAKERAALKAVKR